MNANYAVLKMNSQEIFKDMEKYSPDYNINYGKTSYHIIIPVRLIYRYVNMY